MIATQQTWRIRHIEAWEAPDLHHYLVTISNDTNNNTRWRINTVLTRVTDVEEMIAHHEEMPNWNIFVAADEDDHIIGVIFCKGGTEAINNHEVEISLSVDRRWRGHGIGSAMISQAIDWADSIGNVRRITLECLARNEAAQRLYERLGFSVEGVKYGAYCLWDEGELYIDAVQMAYYLD